MILHCGLVLVIVFAKGAFPPAVSTFSHPPPPLSTLFQNQNMSDGDVMHQNIVKAVPWETPNQGDKLIFLCWLTVITEVGYTVGEFSDEFPMQSR